MGSGDSKEETTLKSSELKEFQNVTLFSQDTLIKLHEYYRRLSGLQTDDGVIDFEEFCMVINKKDKNLTKRIFQAIDINSDGNLNFREYIKFIAVFINGTLEEQINLSYKIFMNSQTKLIDYNNMKNMLIDIVSAEESLENFFTSDIIENLVKETFITLTGSIDYPINKDLYKEMIKKQPYILHLIKLDLANILKCKNLQDKKTIGCFS